MHHRKGEEEGKGKGGISFWKWLQTFDALAKVWFVLNSDACGLYRSQIAPKNYLLPDRPSEAHRRQRHLWSPCHLASNSIPSPMNAEGEEIKDYLSARSLSKVFVSGTSCNKPSLLSKGPQKRWEVLAVDYAHRHMIWWHQKRMCLWNRLETV